MSATSKRKRRQSGKQALREAVRRPPRKALRIPHLRALSDLPDKRRHFVLAYCGLAGGDLSSWWQGAPAAREAGYSHAYAAEAAYELLGEEPVRAAIDEVKAWLDRQNDDQRRRILAGIDRIAFDPEVSPGTRLRAMELYLRAIGHLQEPGVHLDMRQVQGGAPRTDGATVEQISRVRQVMGLPAIDTTATESRKGQNPTDSQREVVSEAIASEHPGGNGHARHAPAIPADDDEAE